MKSEQVAKEYAKALFDVAVEKNMLEKLLQEIDMVGEVLTDPEFEGFFLSVQHTGEEKKSVFNKAFLHEVSVQARNFFWIMFDNGRENLFNEIRNELERLVDEHSKRVLAKVVTAIPLEDALKTKMQTELSQATGKEVLIETVVDPSIYGGMLIYADGRIIDASIKSRLNNLRERLIQT